MKYQISPSKFIFFIVMSSIFFITAVYFPVLIKKFNNISWIAIIIAILMVVLLLLCFPSFNEGFNPLKSINKSSPIKFILSSYLIFSTILHIIICSILIKTVFYHLTPIIIIIFALTLPISVLTNQTSKCIFDTGTVFFFISLLIYILPLTSSSLRKLYLLLPIHFNFELSYILLMLLFPLDLIVYTFYNPIVKGGIKKKHLILATVLLLGYFMFIVIDSVTLLGSQYLNGIPFGGFLRWEYINDNRFFQSFDILMLFLVTIITIYKSAINLNLVKLINNIKIRKSNIIICFLSVATCSFIGCNFYKEIENNFITILIIFLIQIMIIFIYLNVIGRIDRSVKSKRNIWWDS